TITYETYPTGDENAHGYKVRKDGVVIADQPYTPGAEGFTPMTLEEAETHAQAALEEYMKPPPPEPEPEPEPVRPIDPTQRLKAIEAALLELAGEIYG
ncbi:MAG: hypothetical protein FWG72_01945, partial [Oscillospiraceae bacterium]|nr:hypothetical protein [Oscillospiraceae bacterium]